MVTLSASRAGRPAYTAFHRGLHWLIAAVVTLLFVTALSMEGAEGAARDRLYELHWSLGVLVLVLMLVRIASRLAAPPAPLSVEIPRAQRRLAHAVHGSLYALLVVQPILGYAAKASFGGAIPVFWLFDLPRLLPVDQPLAERLFEAHAIAGYLILALVALHVAAALHHALKDDGTFDRMTTR